MDSATQKLNQKAHWLTGGFVFLVSLLTYMRTVAPTTSFWDCGEFIACSKILGVMHPPGAPLYLLIGRIMTMFPFVKDIGLRVNLFSVFISAITIWLTYLIIAHLIRRWRGQPRTWEDRLILFGSAAFGAIAFAFTDSFWFNAVEAEVYAFSMFFTAIVVWLALYWGEHSEDQNSIAYIILIFYLFGLAIGVHLLNLLAYPVILLIAYFHHNITVKRLLMLIFLQALVPISLYVLFFQFDPAKMNYNQIVSHQANATHFLYIFGAIWLGITLIYMYFKDRYVFKIWWIIPGLVVIAYSTYLVIYLRANLHPPINENDPSTFQGMMDYLARKQYGTEDLMLTFMARHADFWDYQIQKMYTRYFGWQFIGQGEIYDQRDFILEIISFKGLWGLPFFVGLWGAVHHFFRDWKRALAVFVLFFVTGYAIIIYLNQPDPQPRERDYSYVGSFFAFALWIGVGMAGILEWISDLMKNRSKLKLPVQIAVTVILLIVVPVNMFAFNFDSHDRSGNYVAFDYSYNMLETCEPNGIIFTNGDNDTFPLWFLQEVYQIRKDVRVVNLSLLNTDWYIKQLRDEEPKIPIGLSDERIENLAPTGWKTQEVFIKIPQDIQDSLRAQLNSEGIQISDKIKFTVRPSIGSGDNGGLRVADLMVLRILQACEWRRPIYFAVTVSGDNMVGLDSYFRMDGLAFKILPYEVRDVDAAVLETNLLEKYQYRSLQDPDVYINRTSLRLMGNYRSAFMQLAGKYLQDGKNDEAIRIMDEMGKYFPPEKVPFYSERTALAIADLYERAGKDISVEELSKYMVPNSLVSSDEKLMLAQFHAMNFQNWGRAEELATSVLKDNPREARAYQLLLHVYRSTKQYAKAIDLMEDWLRYINPNDQSAKDEIADLQTMVVNDTSGTGVLDLTP